MNSSLKCLVVEDESLAAEIIADYIAEVPFLQLDGILGDAIAAMEYLRTAEVDVLFLDIHLPRLKGLDFLRTLKYYPQVILTTAYPDYALESYELGVVDYLLKPIAFPRFMQAANRLQRAQNAALVTTQKEEDIILAVNKEKIRLRKKDILYIEGMREYVAVHTISERIVVKNSLKNMLAMLGSAFLQIHKSYLVAKSRITTLSATSLTVEGNKLPIGRQYRLQVHQALRSWQ